MVRNDAFTLIELLIVISIILILSAIAIPNFLTAQTRAKLSRVKTDMKTVATALEIYFVDHNIYPCFVRRDMVSWWWTPDSLPPYMVRLAALSTPVSYISSIPYDLFNPGDDGGLTGDWSRGGNHTFIYIYPKGYPISFSSPNWLEIYPNAKWRLASYGPFRNRRRALGWYREQEIGLPSYEYDPTNGTISFGFLSRIGP